MVARKKKPRKPYKYRSLEERMYDKKTMNNRLKVYLQLNRLADQKNKMQKLQTKLKQLKALIANSTRLDQAEKAKRTKLISGIESKLNSININNETRLVKDYNWLMYRGGSAHTPNILPYSNMNSRF